MNTQANKKGFTIIEVVLVLAIAALIFLMIFVALPALQRGQRDTARKNDVGTVVTNITNYTSNNRGKLPSDVDDIDGEIAADRRVGSITTGSAGEVTVSEDVIDVYTGVKCKLVSQGSKVEFENGSEKRSFAVVTQLEGNSESGFCQDNG